MKHTVPSRKPWLPQHIVLQALAMTAIVAVTTPLFFRYYGLHVSLWFWVVGAVFNFLFFVAALSFMRWLHRQQETWSSTTQRWFGFAMLTLATALFIIALYIRASR